MNKMKKIIRTLGKGFRYLIPVWVVFGAMVSIKSSFEFFGGDFGVFVLVFWVVALFLAMIYDIGRDIEANKKSDALYMEREGDE